MIVTIYECHKFVFYFFTDYLYEYQQIDQYFFPIRRNPNKIFLQDSLHVGYGRFSF